MQLAIFRTLSRAQWRTFTGCFLGWTFDAFDFFILTYCLDSVASSFHVNLVSATEAFFWTLCMRPVGAVLFGLMAERFGRKPTLMLNIFCFSCFRGPSLRSRRASASSCSPAPCSASRWAASGA